MTATETLRAAAKLMRERAQAATPGPWERPLDTRHKDFVMAALPAHFSTHKGPTGRYAGQRERVGVVSAAIMSVGGFIRKRSGRDLDYIASMHPLVALEVADWLDEVADDRHPGLPSWVESAALAIARAYLGEVAA